MLQVQKKIKTMANNNTSLNTLISQVCLECFDGNVYDNIMTINETSFTLCVSYPDDMILITQLWNKLEGKVRDVNFSPSPAK